LDGLAFLISAMTAPCRLPQFASHRADEIARRRLRLGFGPNRGKRPCAMRCCHLLALGGVDLVENVGHQANFLGEFDKVIDLGAGSTTGDRFARLGNAIGDRVGEVGGVERRAGIQRNDIARRAGLVFQRSQQHGLRFLGIGDAQDMRSGDHQGRNPRDGSSYSRNLAVLQFAYQGRRTERDLVDAVLAPAPPCT
jgi:hypothetical protein